MQATEQCPKLVEPSKKNIRLFFPPSLDKQVNYSKWYNTMKSYTKRELSHQNDKLPAISGRAEAFEATTGITGYVAGLWEDDLLQGLLWCVSPPNKYSYKIDGTKEKFRHPSWSWASVDRPVHWVERRHIRNLYRVRQQRPNP
jgi:hypothetical protein